MKFNVLMASLVLATLSNFSLAQETHGPGNSAISDLEVESDHKTTISVKGCKTAEVGTLDLKLSAEGTHTLVSKCEPVDCTYMDENKYPYVRSATWIIVLTPRESFSRNLQLYTVLNRGVETVQERDMLIKEYKKKGLCKASKKIEHISFVK